VKWVSKRYYKKCQRKLLKERKEEWHSWWAYWPVRIPEHTENNIVVPCHYVWWEWVDRRKNDSRHLVIALFDRDGRWWRYRPSTAEEPKSLAVPTIEEVMAAKVEGLMAYSVMCKCGDPGCPANGRHDTMRIGKPPKFTI
jgi:hypothetical protein